MGYDLHITRKTQWHDEVGPAITEAEWRAVVEDDPELTLDAEAQCTMADGEYVLADWNGEPCGLGYYRYRGEIRAKNPDDPLILKMVEIAQRLNANVQGDDGERYPEALGEREKKKPSLWRRLFGIG